MTDEIVIDGAPLSMLASGYSIGSVEYRRPGGSHEMTWAMDLAPGARVPQFLSPRPRVELRSGSSVTWAGYMDAATWGDGEMSALGTYRLAELAGAIDLSGPTLVTNDAIYFAAARGAFPVGTLTNFPTLSDETATDVNLLWDLLIASAMRVNQEPVVSVTGLLSMSPIATTPTRFVAAGAAELGTTVETQCTSVLLSYCEANTYKTKLAVATDSSVGTLVERRVDFSDAPSMTSIQAQALALTILGRFGPLKQFEGSITVGVEDVCGAGAQPLHPSMIDAGRMYRLMGSRDGRTGAPHTDFVAAASSWNYSTGEVTLTPMNSAADDFASVIESLGGVAS